MKRNFPHLPVKSFKSLRRRMLDAPERGTARPAGSGGKSSRDAKKSIFSCRTHFSVSWAENPPPSCFPVLTEAARHNLAEYFTRNLSNSSFLILQASCLETEKDVLLKPVSTHDSAASSPCWSVITSRWIPVTWKPASRLFPLTGSIDTWAYSLLFKLFYSIGEQIPLVLSFDNLQYMDSASLDFISMLIRGRNPNILFFGTVLPFCSNMNKILKPLCEENLLSHLEISPPAPVESGTAVKAMKADYYRRLSGPAESLSHTGISVLERALRLSVQSKLRTV